MIVGICRLTLLASHCHSLKEKRSVVRRLKDRIKQKYSVVLAEVGGQDTWQRAVIGFAVVGSQRSYVEATLGKIAATIERMGEAEVAGIDREIITYGDGPMIGPDDDDSWIPDAWKEDEPAAAPGEDEGSDGDAG